MIIDLVCSCWCPVNSLTDVSFIMAVHGENTFFPMSGHREKKPYIQVYNLCPFYFSPIVPNVYQSVTLKQR